VRAIGVTTNKRNSQLPDVPAIAETIPGFPEMRSWVGVFAPRGTPPEITRMLGREILAVTESPELLKALSPNGFERLPLAGADLGNYVQSELKKWKTLIEQAGIKPE
jgi:tripartite-type tricarboxylate transporter receptor subunit TctC